MKEPNGKRQMTRSWWRPAWWLAAAAVVCLAGGCAAGNGAQPAGRSGLAIGVLEPQRVLSETAAGKKATESMTTFTKTRQAVVELEEKELRRMEQDFMKQASVLSANAKKEREEQFRRRMMEYQQKVNQMNQEVQEKQKEVLEGFRERLERVAARVAQQMGLAMIVEKGKGSPTIYYDASLDITAKVVEEFNKGGM